MPTSIQEDALRLAALDRRLVRAAVEWNTEELSNALAEYQTLRKNIKVRLLDEPVYSVENSEAAEIIKKILGGIRLIYYLKSIPLSCLYHLQIACF